MKEFPSNRDINGTWGEVWFDDDYLGEVISCTAAVDIVYGDVSRCRHLVSGKKMTKMEGKATVKLHHVRSNIAKKISDKIKRGETPSYKIISKLEDPDAFGAERVVLYDCKPDKTSLLDWEAEKLGEESYNFTFEDWDFLDYIDV